MVHHGDAPKDPSGLTHKERKNNQSSYTSSRSSRKSDPERDFRRTVMRTNPYEIPGQEGRSSESHIWTEGDPQDDEHGRRTSWQQAETRIQQDTRNTLVTTGTGATHIPRGNWDSVRGDYGLRHHDGEARLCASCGKLIDSGYRTQCYGCGTGYHYHDHCFDRHGSQLYRSDQARHHVHRTNIILSLIHI